jgi:hypothetical protein
VLAEVHICYHQYFPYREPGWWIKMKRVLPWIVSNADTLVALSLAILVSILSLVGAVSTALVANATVVTLAVLAFIMLHDRKLQEDTRGLVGRLEDKFDARNSIRILTGANINHAVTEARRHTEQWFFRGSTATYVRVAIMPECINRARRAGKEFRVRLEILDPTSTVACDSYVRLYRSLAEDPNSPEIAWTVKGTRIELYATIMAACWHKQRYEPLTVEIGLSTVASTFRWEASSQYFLLTQRGPRFPAMLIEREDPFYSLFVSELNASFRQARRVPLELATDVRLSDDPTIEETRVLFSKLGLELPSDLEDEDVSEIVTKALHDENPYNDTGS